MKAAKQTMRIFYMYIGAGEMCFLMLAVWWQQNNITDFNLKNIPFPIFAIFAFSNVVHEYKAKVSSRTGGPYFLWCAGAHVVLIRHCPRPVMWSETVGLRTRPIWDQKHRSWSCTLWSWCWSCRSGVILWNTVLSRSSS